MRLLQLIMIVLLATAVSAQEHLQNKALASDAKKTFTIVKENAITSVKNQHRSGTCWAYGTLGYFESERLRKTGKTCMATARTVSSIVRKGAKEPLPHWQDSVEAVIDSPFLLAGYRDRWSADFSRNSRYNGSYNQPLYKP